MKTQLEKLAGLDLDLFYSVTIRKRGVELQGSANDDTIKLSKELVEDLEFDNENEWLYGGKDGISICLTF